MITNSIRWFFGGTRSRQSDPVATVAKAVDTPAVVASATGAGDADVDAARALVGAPAARTPSGGGSSGASPLGVRLAELAPTAPKLTAPIHVGDRVLHQRGSKSFEVARVLDIDEERGVYYIERKPIYETDAAVLHVERAKLRAAVSDEDSPYRKGDIVCWVRASVGASTVEAVFEGGSVLAEGANFAHDPSELTSFSTTMKTAAGTEVKAGDIVSYAAGLARFKGVTADGVVHGERLSENRYLPALRLNSGMEATFSPSELGALVTGLEGTPYAPGTKIAGGVIRAVYDNGTVALDNENRAVAGPPRIDTTVRADADVVAFLARHARRRAAPQAVNDQAAPAE